MLPTRPFTRASARFIAGIATLLASVTGCVPTFDDNLSLVREPIVLAVQSEPAEAAPGETVRLTVLTASGDPDDSPPQTTWGLCVARKPLTELGPVNPVCVQSPNQAPNAIVPLGNGSSVSATLPAPGQPGLLGTSACQLFGPSLPEAMNGEPAGRPVDPDPTGGFYQPVGVTLLDSGVTSLGAVRIFCPPSGLDQEQAGAYKANYRNNQNPSIDALEYFDDSALPQPVPAGPAALVVAPRQKLRFRASWATCPTSVVCGDGVCSAQEDKNNCAVDCAVPKGCTGAEVYAWFNPDSGLLNTRHESIRVSWFATAGRFDNAVTGREESEFASNSTDDSWTAPEAVGNVRVWLVIRDARGGQSFQSFLVSVR